MTEPTPTNGTPRITPLRVVLAVVVFVVLCVGSLGYHDAAYDVQDVGATGLREGDYRFKGTLVSYDALNESFDLRDDTGNHSYHWNITRPEEGQVYVVNAIVHPDGQREAVALSRVLVFEGRWF